MASTLRDMEALVEDIRDDLQRVKALRDVAHALAVKAQAAPQYDTDPEWRAATNAVVNMLVGPGRL